MEIKKSYYAIIPANVRYDEELTPNAKLLYGEITALANEKGYCWASNSYFAELYKVSKETVSRWISKLEEKGHVMTQLVYKGNSKEVEERRIYIAPPIDKNVNTPLTKSSTPYCENNQDPIDENVNTLLTKSSRIILQCNNTSNNTFNKELQKDCNGEINFKFLDSDVEIELARFMIDEILRIKPDSKVPDSNLKSLQNWGQQIDYMMRIDNRDPRDIAELFRWTQESDFWVANVRSPRKLREKWDTLELQRDRNKPKVAKSLSNLEEMYQKVKAEEEGI